MKSFFKIYMALTVMLGVSIPSKAADFKLVLVGDVMMGSDFPTKQLPPREGKTLLSAASPLIENADLALGNLEGTIGQGGHSRKAGCDKCYAFRMPPYLGQRLKEAGFDGFSLANNHAMDFGSAGLAATAHHLTNQSLRYTGPAGWNWAEFALPQGNVCFLAYAPNSGMNDLRNIQQMETQVKRAKKSCTLVVVSFHGGGEGLGHERTPRGDEFFLGENRGNVRAFSRAAINAGASLVFGHGPHIARGMEVYQGHLIAYSLGNFITYGGISTEGALGSAPLMEVDLDQRGRFLRGKIHSFKQQPGRGLIADPRHKAFALMEAMTQRDFNGGGLKFRQNAEFFPSIRN